MPPHPEVAHLTPACLGSKGKQREEGGVEYLGRNKAIGQKKCHEQVSRAAGDGIEWKQTVLRFVKRENMTMEM